MIERLRVWVFRRWGEFAPGATVEVPAAQAQAMVAAGCGQLEGTTLASDLRWPQPDELPMEHAAARAKAERTKPATYGRRDMQARRG